MLKVWDLFVRFNHWLLVLLIASAWLSSEFGDAEFKWHSINGYIIFVLVISRIIWGFIGSTTARFTHFIKSPNKAINYLKDLRNGKDADYLGHNPAGGWMVVAILLTLIAQAVTGMFSADDVLFEGPFSYYISSSLVSSVTQLHHLLFDGLIVLIGLHIAAVLYHQVIKKEKLIEAMITGVKKNVANAEQELKFKPFYFSLIIVAVVAFGFWWLLRRT